MTSRVSDPFDFERCEDEPIRTPGAIQNFGALRLVSEDVSRILADSDNAGELFAELPGATGPLELPEGFVGRLARAVLSPAAGWPLRESVGDARGRWHLTAHRLPGTGVLVELEPGLAGGNGATTAISDLDALVGRVRAARTVDELMATAAEAVRGITGFDRVMVYRFAEDWHGEVLAESRAEHMSSYLGLHFPASDIPAQARALYVENQIRLIADVDAPVLPVHWREPALAESQLDLSQVSLRAVSPIHLQYLRNMGVGASLSISVMRDDQLWGMVACHHAQPRHVPLEARMAAKLVGDVLSMCLRMVEEAERNRARLQLNLYQREVLDRFVHSDELIPSLNRSAEDLQRLFGASGFVVIDGQHCHPHGRVPTSEQLLTLAEDVRQQMQAEELGLYQQNGWQPSLFPRQEETAAGVIALAPTADYRVLVLWLRAHEPTEVVWAGAREPDVDHPLDPRRSFAHWSELRRGLARPWAVWELEAAEELLSAMRKLGLRQMERLQQLSENLERSNKDLEDFALIASHDLQEPLRKIEAFSSLMREEARPGQLEGLTDYLDRIANSAGRLRNLVGDLLTYSRVGRVEYQYVRCDWRQTVDKVLQLLTDEIDHAGARVRVEGAFPVTHASPVLLRMIFQNLISNAIKYRDADRPCEVVVRGQESSGQWQVTVSDNGIGFSQQYAEEIFNPFMRLNRGRRFTGSGIGLAIVRKAAERLGVTVDATSTPGEGSRFSLRLAQEEDADKAAIR